MKNPLEIFPWHSRQWERVEESFHRFPHATLISGIEGIGKLSFSTRLAMKLLCDVPEKSPCGACRACHLFVSSAHLDMHFFSSEALHKGLHSPIKDYSARYHGLGQRASKRKTARTTILIAQTRALIQEAITSAQISKNKVFLVMPADAMTTSASNSILKILEEPALNTYLILVTENARNLLPTISSRCQIIHLTHNLESEIQAWLSQHDFSEEEIEKILVSREGPLLALRNRANNKQAEFSALEKKLLQILAEPNSANVLQVAQFTLKVGAIESLRKLHLLTAALIRKNLLQDDATSNDLDEFSKIAKKLSARDLFEIYDYIGHIHREIKDGSLDQQLVMEDIFLRYSNL